MDRILVVGSGSWGTALVKILLENNDSKLEIIRTVPWKEEGALFGKPCSCLLGPEGKTIEKLPDRLKVCINKKYSAVAKKFL